MFNEMFQAKTEKQVDKQLNAAAAAANACLSTDSFSYYRKQYEKAESKMLEAMMMMTESYYSGNIQLEAYGAKMLVYMTRLKDLRSLLDKVTRDARK